RQLAAQALKLAHRLLPVPHPPTASTGQRHAHRPAVAAVADAAHHLALTVEKDRALRVELPPLVTDGTRDNLTPKTKKGAEQVIRPGDAELLQSGLRQNHRQVVHQRPTLLARVTPWANLPHRLPLRRDFSRARAGKAVFYFTSTASPERGLAVDG